jgi:hypothetical protein
MSNQSRPRNKAIVALGRTAQMAAILAALIFLACGCASVSTASPRLDPHGTSPAQTRRVAPLPPVVTAAHESNSHLAAGLRPGSQTAALAPTGADANQPRPTDSETDADETGRAAQARAMALKASQEAAKAAAEAAKAAELAGVTPSAQRTPAAPAPLVLSSSGEAGPFDERRHSADMINSLSRSLQRVPRKGLNADGSNRVELAQKFLQGAQKAFADASYAEAEGLARKGSSMLSPLIKTSNQTSP